MTLSKTPVIPVAGSRSLGARGDDRLAPVGLVGT